MATKDWKKYREKSNGIYWWNESEQEGIGITQFIVEELNDKKNKKKHSDKKESIH